MTSPHTLTIGSNYDSSVTNGEFFKFDPATLILTVSSTNVFTEGAVEFTLSASGITASYSLDY